MIITMHMEIRSDIVPEASVVAIIIMMVMVKRWVEAKKTCLADMTTMIKIVNGPAPVHRRSLGDISIGKINKLEYNLHKQEKQNEKI